MAATGITPQSITNVMQAACREHTDEQLRLSLLMRAFVAGCKALGVPHRVMMRELDKAWADDYNFVPLLTRKPS